MTAHRLRSLATIVTLLCFLLAAWSLPAEAQKKQKKTPTKVQQKETPKEEPKEEEPKEEQEEPAAETTVAPASVSLPGKFLDVLKKYTGEKTNLGTIRRLAGDYLVLEEEYVTTLVPFSAIQSVRLVKDDESSPAHLEIKLIARD
jgi:hypothetical protein